MSNVSDLGGPDGYLGGVFGGPHQCAGGCRRGHTEGREGRKGRVRLRLRQEHTRQGRQEMRWVMSGDSGVLSPVTVSRRVEPGSNKGQIGVESGVEKG
eukprot:514597-Prorocentrum_minimum.AAC.1